MAKKLSLGLVIGGAVSSTLGAAFGAVSGHIKKLEQQGSQTRVLHNTIGETIRLRDEWKKAHASGSESAGKLHKQLERNNEALRKQGIAVDHLDEAYQTLGRTTKGLDLKLKGHQQLEAGKAGVKSSLGMAVGLTAAAAVPTKISADYQAIIRDIAIKSGVAGQPQEATLSRTVIQTSQDTGMARNAVADLVNQLVGAGMALDKAMAYAPTAATFAVGQGASGVDTARMIVALQQNAKISDPAQLQKALEMIALQGQAGSFEAADMAKWFPQLLASMDKQGITGLDSVNQLGAMLQVQMKTAGGSDEAANNLRNWLEKIGSGGTVKAYKDAGIDYQASMATGIQGGKSTMEASFYLAQRYIEKTDPAKAAKMAEAQSAISKEADPAKAKAMLDALEKALRTGDLFADMQVKAALMAYGQNRGLYEQLKKDGQNAEGILAKNLAERRGASQQIWAETFQSLNDSLRSVGDAIRPATDALGLGITVAAKAFTGLSDDAKTVVLSVGGLAAGLIGLKSAISIFQVGRGLLNIGRGSVLDRKGQVQKVYVTNSPDGDGLGGDSEGTRRKKKRRPGVRQRARAIAKVRVQAARPVKLAAPVTTRLGAVSTAGKVASALGGASKLARLVPGGSAMWAGIQAVNTYQNAETRDEKAEGYGGAAGGLAGGLAGAAVGAALGSVVPGIGTAIVGLIGGVLGSMGGTAGGGWLGGKIFGAEQPEATVAPTGSAGAQLAAVLKTAPANQEAAAAAKIEQQFSFAPQLALTVQGDVKDPAQLVNDLMPHIRQQFEEFSRQVAQRQLFDAPHV